MTCNPIVSKDQMYALLARGAFGNTTRQWFSVADWQASEDHDQYPLWGVRTMTPGGPCRLNCPTGAVPETAASFQSQGHAVQLSMMIDAVVRVTLWADVADTADGLVVYGVEYPPCGGSWRKLMPTQGKTYKGLAAYGLLDRHLNANSRADLEVLREQYPFHVVELSACDRCLGMIPGRSAVIWECRMY